MGEEGVLLGLVEAVDLVDEQHAALAVQGEQLLGGLETGPHLGNPGHHRGQNHELGADRLGEDARQRRLAGPGRPPQQERCQVAARDRASERPRIADEVLLALVLIERARPHPRGERLPLGWWLEEGFGSGTGDSTRPSQLWHRGPVYE